MEYIFLNNIHYPGEALKDSGPYITIYEVHTKRPPASVTIKYSFSKDVIHTDTREDINL